MQVEDPVSLPYTYYKADRLEFNNDAPVKISYPLVVYFASAAERKQFALAVKAAMKKRGKYLVGHLK